MKIDAVEKNIETRLSFNQNKLNQMIVEKEYTLEELQGIVFSHYGYVAQLEKLEEEMTELLIEIKRYKRTKTITSDFKSELADVLNMVCQFKNFLGKGDIEKIQYDKMRRTIKKIRGKNNA